MSRFNEEGRDPKLKELSAKVTTIDVSSQFNPERWEVQIMASKASQLIFYLLKEFAKFEPTVKVNKTTLSCNLSGSDTAI